MYKEREREKNEKRGRDEVREMEEKEQGLAMQAENQLLQPSIPALLNVTFGLPEEEVHVAHTPRLASNHQWGRAGGVGLVSVNSPGS